ncbi:MAG: diguanylate cyclase [Solirubrobacteraceae bacterium]|jgi:EAL domain-containing protein (putative c-di-GMP-specific phosphodiesterase class I)|nr:diguanylate cyclase [Solirubrobacteraceae bacterium]
MRYTINQRQTFAILVLASLLGALWLTSAHLGRVWVVLYAALFPAIFRAIIVASAHVEPTNPWMLMRVWLAMRRGEIVLHYQPKVTLATGETTRVEALARWNHPRLGQLLPGQWLHATESRWLEMRFSRYVLDAAIRQASLWRRDMRDLLVEINVSPRSFADQRLVRVVADLLERWDLPPSFIALEITEAALEMPERALTVADQLTAMGVSLALDDFGIGHSSFDRLVRLPFAEIKIDKRFVIGMLGSDRHRAVVNAVINLGHGLGMDVVGEGVETAATRDRLLAGGCDKGQGFLFSPALPPGELTKWIDSQRLQRLASPETPRADPAVADPSVCR